MRAKVMLVDDEPNVLKSYARNLRDKYELTTCEGGEEALAAVAELGPFAVVVSDMRMAEMDGVEFLSRLKQQQPDTVRMMLTGNSDQQTAVDAVNQGDVFRFLNKPCTSADMALALDAGIEQYRLIRAEKDLLENTLHGAISALSDVLFVMRPEDFGRTSQVHKEMQACEAELGIREDWQLASVAMFSLIGTVALPDSLVRKALSGAELTEDEEALFTTHPATGAAILEKIPRLEAVAQAVRYQLKNYDGSGFPVDSRKGEDIPFGARLLRPIWQLNLYERAGRSSVDALALLQCEADKYDPDILQALVAVRHEMTQTEIIEIKVHNLRVGMTLAKDLLSSAGSLVLAQDLEVTEAVRDRLINSCENRTIGDTIYVRKETVESSN